MRVIGLAGKAGAGKDYTYSHILSGYEGVVRVAFADGVRREIEEALLGDDEAGVVGLNALWKKPTSEEVRALLQWWGTDFRRAQDPDYWVKKGVKRLKDLGSLPSTRLAVVTDVRFENEAQAIRDLGGIVVEVIAHDSFRRDRLGGQLPPSHASEEIDFDVDFHIVNNRVLEIPWQVANYIHLSQVESE